MQWYLKALRQYADFHGRARRTEFWMFVLINIAVLVVLVLLDNLLGLASPERPTRGALSSVYSLAVTLPSWAVGARRMHDIGRRGWWQLLLLLPVLSVPLAVVLPGWLKLFAVIPLAGLVVVIVWWATPGKTEVNRWGANPKLIPAQFRVR